MSIPSNPPLAPPVDKLAGTYPVVLRGLQAVLAAHPLLIDLASRSSQGGAADYLDFFLHQPYTGGKIPHLVLLTSKAGCSISDLAPPEILAAALLHEYQIARLPLAIFVTEDLAGERNVIAPAAIRSEVALRVTRHLLSQGAHLVVLSLKDGEFAPEPASPNHGRSPRRVHWATARRTLTRRLPLAASYDATLGTLGSHTRRNLRYYRRRVETQLGCVFVPQADITEEQFVALNRMCSYPTPEFVARWRHRSTHTVPGGIFAGIRSAAGEWLSIVGGRRYHGTSSIDWQLNQTSFSTLSLSTVMRSYLMEHEIAQGSHTLLFEGGTPHPMQLSFAPDHVVDLIAARSTLRAALLRRLARLILPRRNFLAQTLSQPDLAWRPW